VLIIALERWNPSRMSWRYAQPVNQTTLLDPRHKCPANQTSCMCPRIGIPDKLLEPVVSNFPAGCVRAFQDAVVGTAKARIKRLTDRQTKNLPNVLQAIRNLPSSTSGLHRWAEGILSNLFISESSGLIESTEKYFQINVEIEPFLKDLKRLMSDSVVPLIALVEIIPKLDEQLRQATESHALENQQAKRILTRQQAALTKFDRNLNSYIEEHEEEEALEKLAKTVDSVATNALSLSDKVQNAVSSNQRQAMQTLSNISRFLQDARSSLYSSESIESTARNGCLEGTSTLFQASRELVPKISDGLQAQEARDIEQLQSTVHEISTCASEQTKLLEDLVQALETSHEALQKYVEGIKLVEQSAANLQSQANTISGSRSHVLSDAKSKVQKSAPRKLYLEAIHHTCKIHVDETKKIVRYLDRACQTRLHAMYVDWEEISALYLLLKEGHESCLLAGDLSSLTRDDLKILLQKQGLYNAADIFEGEEIDGSILSSALCNKKAEQTAAELEDIFKGMITDLVSRKRVVHYVQLAYFGLDVTRHSIQTGMGNPQDPCCQWSCERLKAELQNGGFSDILPKLSNINGEVLLLLSRSDLRDLGISVLATQQRCVWLLLWINNVIYLDMHACM
jgi:hypothetical protein